MTKSSLLGLCLVATVCFSGCSSTKSKIPFSEAQCTDSQEALVYVYRMKNNVGGAGACKIAGNLRQGAYMVLHLPPGSHSITIGEPGPIILGPIVETIASNPSAFNARAGETYYIRSSGFDVSFKTREEAMPELSTMKFDMGM